MSPQSRQKKAQPDELFVLMAIPGLLVAIGLVLLILTVKRYLRERSLVDKGITVTAQLTRVFDSGSSKNRHRYAGYVYFVGVSRLMGFDAYPGSLRDTGPVQITHPPSDPGFSMIDPAASARDLWLASVGLGVATALVGGASAYGLRRRL